MALTFREIYRDFRRGGRKMTVNEIRFDNAYPGQSAGSGYAIAASDVGMDTQIEHMEIWSSDVYIVLGTDDVSKRVVAFGPHTSQGTGGNQLNSGSTALNNGRAILVCYGS